MHPFQFFFSEMKFSTCQSEVVPDDLPEAVMLAPDRSDHMRHVRRLNRFLRKIERDPNELLEKVSKKMTQDLPGEGGRGF